MTTREAHRLLEADTLPGGTGHAQWRLWGPYLAGRQWGTVREDYSANGDAWDFFPFDHAHRRAYRWGEDGIAGLCDEHGFLNLALACWNGADDRLKERYFGLTNGQGNHGEDVKEYWWHLDATPSHSYASSLYRYPQQAYPYERLLAENAARDRTQREFELTDTGIFADNRFFDIVVTHAKASPTDVLVEVTATNHGPDPGRLDLLPQLWFRNTWAWGRDDRVPSLRLTSGAGQAPVVEATHAFLGAYRLHVEDPQARVLFCDNETDAVGLFGAEQGRSRYPKNAIDRAVVHGEADATNPANVGTKCAVVRHWDAVAPGQTVRLRLRLVAADEGGGANGAQAMPFGTSFDEILAARRAEADEFYHSVIPPTADDVDRDCARRAFAGLLWCKQHYRYDVAEWLEGDPAGPPAPEARLAPEPFARNTSWRTLALADVISMPDEWEYPWFATWDLAFHCVTMAHLDPAFAKAQLLLMVREWAQHPNGALPAYEWSFSDVNPPVHAWAAWQVYVIDGSWDRDFLVKVFTKKLMNFTWWQNQKDPDGSNLFEGGFLGMDNIALFDRSKDVPPGWRLEQSDATSWMAFTSMVLMRVALELARDDAVWSDLVTTFLERFCAIAEALEAFGSGGVSLWNEQDGFFYDTLVPDQGEPVQLEVRSLVGLVPLLGVGIIPAWAERDLPEVRDHVMWLEKHRPDLAGAIVAQSTQPGVHRMVRLVDEDRIMRLLQVMLDESELLSPYGIRSLSAAYRNGFQQTVDGHNLGIRYDPGESSTGLFGGNSNWRGPVWFPINALLVSALREIGAGLAPAAKVELPRGSGHWVSLGEAADELEGRLIALFRPGPDGRRPSDPHDRPTDPLWLAYPTFSEYFHGDTGEGLGASHQTGWTALVAHLICTMSDPDLRLVPEPGAEPDPNQSEPDPHHDPQQGA